MTKNKPIQLEFSDCRGRKVQANFSGTEVSSDGDLLLLREVDRRVNLTKQAADTIRDDRQPGKVRHRMEQMIAQIQTFEEPTFTTGPPSAKFGPLKGEGT
jgi:hypothetical protein